MLQHANTTNEESCHVLEQERKRFAIDNKMLTDRMNGMNDWTEEVDVKLLKLYRYVQPTRVEWRIQKVAAGSCKLHFHGERPRAERSC